MYKRYHDFLIRDWTSKDRQVASHIIGSVLEEFGLDWEPQRADIDVIDVEKYYFKTGGEFWVIENDDKVVGTAAYYPLPHHPHWAEIRKMYLLPEVRGKGLGQYLLTELETVVQTAGFEAILIETSTKLSVAMKLYERNHYAPYTEVETERCDRAYIKYLS